MTISVIIPTRGRPASLQRMLDALVAQSLSKDGFEVIVVENDSNTAHGIAQRYAGHFPYFQFLREPRPGQALARNRGIGAARGSLVVFLDDDVIADPPLLEEYLRVHQQHPEAAVLGFVRFPWTGRESPLHWVLARRPEYLNSFRFGDPLNVPFAHFYTCNSAVPRAFFSTLGAFDERLSGYGFEDSEFAYRLARSGGRIVFARAASALHDHRADFRSFATKRYQAGRALEYMLAKHPELRPTFVPPRRAWRRRLTCGLGFLGAPLVALFDQRLPGWALPLLGRFCQYRLEYRFWAGYRGATA